MWLLSIKQARESSWSPDPSGIEESPPFFRAVGSAGPALGVAGGSSWLSVCAPGAQGGARQELLSQRTRLSLMQGERSFEMWECQSIQKAAR